MNEQSEQQQGAAAPQYSPDGRWLWNGQEWLPVQASPPPSSSHHIRPGRWPYLVAVLVVLMAAALVVLVIQGFRTGFPANAVRVTAPGTTEITLAQSGTYTISYERQMAGDVGGGVYVSSGPASIPAEISSMRLRLVSIASGNLVDHHPISGSFSYQLGSTEGVGVATFTIDRPGRYSVTTQYANGESGPPVVLAIAHGSPGDAVLYTLGGFAAFALLLAAGAIGAVTLFLRIRAKDRVRAVRGRSLQ